MAQLVAHQYGVLGAACQRQATPTRNSMTYTFYIIRNPKGILYKGVTYNLEKRKKNKKKGIKTWTRKKGPWSLIYGEKFENKNDALKAERFYKSGQGREVLKKLLSECGAVGSAPVWGTGGRRFESAHSDQKLGHKPLRFVNKFLVGVEE